MPSTQLKMAERIAHAVAAFQQQRTGHEPGSVTVVLSGDTLVVTLHGALSRAERAMAQSPEGAATVQEFHRELFHSASAALRDQIKHITGMEVQEAAAEVEPATGAVIQVFTTGTMVQVFQLAGKVETDTFEVVKAS